MMDRTTVVYRPTKAHKAWLALLGGLVMYLTGAFGDDAFSLGEVGEGVLLFVEAVGTAVAVYAKPNPPTDK